MKNVTGESVFRSRGCRLIEEPLIEEPKARASENASESRVATCFSGRPLRGMEEAAGS